MKIEIEMTEDAGFIVRNSQGKLWVAREYSLLSRIREAFGLKEVNRHSKQGEVISDLKAPKLKKIKKTQMRNK